MRLPFFALFSFLYAVFVCFASIVCDFVYQSNYPEIYISIGSQFFLLNLLSSFLLEGVFLLLFRMSWKLTDFLYERDLK